MKFKRKRKIKLKKQYFDAYNGNPFDSRSICTSEIVKSAHKLALNNKIQIIEIKDGISLGTIIIITKGTKEDYVHFCRELLDDLGGYLEGYSM